MRDDGPCCHGCGRLVIRKETDETYRFAPWFGSVPSRKRDLGTLVLPGGATNITEYAGVCSLECLHRVQDTHDHVVPVSTNSVHEAFMVDTDVVVPMWAAPGLPSHGSSFVMPLVPTTDFVVLESAEVVFP